MKNSMFQHKPSPSAEIVPTESDLQNLQAEYEQQILSIVKIEGTPNKYVLIVDDRIVEVAIGFPELVGELHLAFDEEEAEVEPGATSL